MGGGDRRGAKFRVNRPACSSLPLVEPAQPPAVSAAGDAARRVSEEPTALALACQARVSLALLHSAAWARPARPRYSLQASADYRQRTEPNHGPGRAASSGFLRARKKRERTQVEVSGRARLAKATREERRTLVVLLRRALLLDDRRGDAVEVTLAVDGDAAAAAGSVVLEDTNLLKGLEDLALDRARAVGVLKGGKGGATSVWVGGWLKGGESDARATGAGRG